MVLETRMRIWVFFTLIFKMSGWTIQLDMFLIGIMNVDYVLKNNILSLAQGVNLVKKRPPEL